MEQEEKNESLKVRGLLKQVIRSTKHAVAEACARTAREGRGKVSGRKTPKRLNSTPARTRAGAPKRDVRGLVDDR